MSSSAAVFGKGTGGDIKADALRTSIPKQKFSFQAFHLARVFCTLKMLKYCCSFHRKAFLFLSLQLLSCLFLQTFPHPGGILIPFSAVDGIHCNKQEKLEISPYATKCPACISRICTDPKLKCFMTIIAFSSPENLVSVCKNSAQ